MNDTIFQDIQVRPRIALLNKMVQEVKDVAISAINPVYEEYNGIRQVDSFQVRVEGPEKPVSLLNQLLRECNLKVG